MISNKELTESQVTTNEVVKKFLSYTADIAPLK